MPRKTSTDLELEATAPTFRADEQQSRASLSAGLAAALSSAKAGRASRKAARTASRQRMIGTSWVERLNGAGGRGTEYSIRSTPSPRPPYFSSLSLRGVRPTHLAGV